MFFGILNNAVFAVFVSLFVPGMHVKFQECYWDPLLDFLPVSPKQEYSHCRLDPATGMLSITKWLTQIIGIN